MIRTYFDFPLLAVDTSPDAWFFNPEEQNSRVGWSVEVAVDPRASSVQPLEPLLSGYELNASWPELWSTFAKFSCLER